MEIVGLAVGILGLIVSVGGFTLALWQITRTRTAAEHAEEAAVDAREVVLRRMSISDLTQAHAIIEELKALHRNQDLNEAIRRYTPLRQILTDVQATLPEESRELFDFAINSLMDMESDIDRAISSENSTVIDTATFNGVLVDIQQTLHELRVQLERSASSSTSSGD